jgi:hypothetical protein
VLTKTGKKDPWIAGFWDDISAFYSRVRNAFGGAESFVAG